MKRETKQILKKILILLVLIGISYIYHNYFEKEEKVEKKIQYRETVPTIQLEDAEFHIHFIDVGQADSILIENNKEYALVDAGDYVDGEKLVKYFNSLGVQKFRYVIGTHAHEDHVGGIPDIINNFEIEHFYMPDVVTTTRTFEDILDALEEKNIAFETPVIDSSFMMNEVKFTVLYIGRDNIDLNNTSIVLKVEYKNTSYLLMADAPNMIEKEILDKDIKSDVLKVGHHGSQYSTSAVFLKKVNPSLAIISVGKDNSYGHPKSITLQKLKRLDIKTYRTDRDGTIIFASNGDDISIQTIKTDTNG